MDNKEKKPRKPWKALLTIPIVLAADVLMFLGSILLDGRIASARHGASGRAIPAVTSVIAIPVLAVSAAVILAAVVIAVKRLAGKKDKNETPTEEPEE